MPDIFDAIYRPITTRRNAHDIPDNIGFKLLSSTV